MKKWKMVCMILALSLILCGCLPIGNLSEYSVDTLEGWSFQYNEGTKDYSLFFALCTAAGTQISARADVDIRIVNTAGETVYEGTKTVEKSDFGYYSSQIHGEKYLANVRIPEGEIAPGKASGGTVYFTVYQEGVFSFSECNCTISDGLPIKDFSITTEALPQEITVKAYDGTVQSELTIESVTYEVNSILTSWVKVTVSGIKTYGQTSSYDRFLYKLYDSQGYMIQSGTVYLDSLSSGDKFREDSIIFYELVPGEEYVIKFFEDN